MRYGSLDCIQKLLLVRNVDLVSSLPAASNLVTRFLFCFSSGAGRERGESGGGGGGGKREREREKRGNNRNEVGESNE